MIVNAVTMGLFTLAAGMFLFLWAELGSAFAGQLFLLCAFSFFVGWILYPALRSRAWGDLRDWLIIWWYRWRSKA